jgi:hypothetical protein
LSAAVKGRVEEIQRATHQDRFRAIITVRAAVDMNVIHRLIASAPGRLYEFVQLLVNMWKGPVNDTKERAPWINFLIRGRLIVSAFNSTSQFSEISQIYPSRDIVVTVFHREIETAY